METCNKWLILQISGLECIIRKIAKIYIYISDGEIETIMTQIEKKRKKAKTL